MTEGTLDRFTLTLALLNAIMILLGYTAGLILDTWQLASPIAAAAALA